MTLIKIKDMKRIILHTPHYRWTPPFNLSVPNFRHLGCKDGQKHLDEAREITADHVCKNAGT